MSSMHGRPSDDGRRNQPAESRALVPAPKVPERRLAKRGGIPVGVQLEHLRKRLGYSVAAVARELWITETTLDAYESGMREPPHDLIERIAEFYHIDPALLLGGGPPDGDSDQLWLGWAELDLSGAITNLERLMVISQTIRWLRRVSEDATVSIRDDELRTVARQLDVLEPGLSADLQRCFRLSHAAAEEVRARLVHAAEEIQQLPAAIPDSASRF